MKPIWTIEVDPRNSRVPWNTKELRSREDLESYLEYFHIQDYSGPGMYACSDSSCSQGSGYLRISYREETR